MRVQTFVGKVSMEGLQHMDRTINEWLASRQPEILHITQTFGQERHREVSNEEPVVITSVWYEPRT